jgi:Cu(I)/Ag(I) efflux system membrane fusion protein
VRALGVTQYDDRAIQEVRVRGEGWVERFPRLGVGDHVRPGQMLFELYSLRLEAAEQEYLNSLSFGDAARLELSATRLRNLGVDEELIHSLKETRKIPHLIPFHAGIGGVLTEVAVHTGSYVLPETVLFRIAPTDPLTVIFEVPQSSGHSIAVGDEVTMSLEGPGGHDLVGKVDTVYPQIEPETRTVKLRVLIPNPRDELRANMYVSGLIRTATGREVLHVPREAVIRGGTSDRLIVALGNGRFAPRAVTVGDESGDRVAVLSGVSEGERVVTSGQFLLDSEAHLQSAPAPPGPGP